jgi:hypothetical protein
VTAGNEPLPPLIRRFFDLAPLPDSEAYFALFSEGAVLEDEDKEYRGIDGIRDWRKAVPLATYEITDVTQAPGSVTATVTISGDFPGSPVTGLVFRFELAGENRIGALRIS